MKVLRWLALSLLVLSVSPAIADDRECPSGAIKEQITRLARAIGEKEPHLEGKDCAAQSATLASIAEKAAARLASPPPNRPAAGLPDQTARRLAMASLVISALALLSAPIITIMLFRRYGLISWRLHIGDSASDNITK